MSKQLIAVQTTGPSIPRKSKSAPAFVGKVDPKTLKAWQALEPALQRRAEKVIREHVRASRAIGCDLASMDRVVIEAIEIARLDADNPEPVGTRRIPMEPYWKYDVYVSPVSE